MLHDRKAPSVPLLFAASGCSRPYRLPQLEGDAEGERIAADTGEMLAEQVSCPRGVTGGGSPDHFDVVAFPVHLPVAGPRAAVPVRAPRSARASPKAGSALTARRSAVYRPPEPVAWNRWRRQHQWLLTAVLRQRSLRQRSQRLRGRRQHPNHRNPRNPRRSAFVLTFRFNVARSCLRHAAAAASRIRKDSPVTCENIRKTGIPGRCHGAEAQDPHKGPQAIAGLESQNAWSGAGSNRRPSAFQGFYHPPNHGPESIQKPSSPALFLVSQSYSHHSDRAAKYRIVPFRLWVSCGARAQARTCGAFVGLAIPILDAVISGDVACNGIHPPGTRR